MGYIEAKKRNGRAYFYLTQNRRAGGKWKKTRRYIGTSRPSLPQKISPHASAYQSTLQKIRVLEKCKGVLRRKFGITSMGVFGSYARGEQQEGSDLDILADFDSAPGLIRLIQAENYISARLGVKADLAYAPGLKPRFKKTIVSEAVFV